MNIINKMSLDQVESAYLIKKYKDATGYYKDNTKLNDYLKEIIFDLDTPVQGDLLHSREMRRLKDDNITAATAAKLIIACQKLCEKPEVQKVFILTPEQKAEYIKSQKYTKEDFKDLKLYDSINDMQNEIAKNIREKWLAEATRKKTMKFLNRKDIYPENLKDADTYSLNPVGNTLRTQLKRSLDTEIKGRMVGMSK